MTGERGDCTRPKLETHAPGEISDYVGAGQWSVFRDAISAARSTGRPFALGGGTAISFYTGMWRGSKDLDLYILPADREAMIRAINGVGLVDYFASAPYDRSWIYRGYRGGTIVDLIWAMANGVADVDESWLTCGARIEMGGEPLQLLAPEEMFWSKVHVLQRDRCDWPDLLNLLFTAGAAFDWQRLLRRMGPREEPLLASVLMLFSWVAPGRAGELPEWLWARLGLRPPQADGPLRDTRKIDLLDTRPWFTPVVSGLASARRASEPEALLPAVGSGGHPRRQTPTTRRRPATGTRSAGTSKA